MRRILHTALVVVLAAIIIQTEAFDGDSGSRSDKSSAASGGGERTLILPLIALWKLRPLLKTFSGGFSGYGTFGGTFGGGALYQQPFYPFPGAIGGIGGYPGVFPGAGYPVGPFNIRGHDEMKPTIVEESELGRLDFTTTSRPPRGFAQSLREFASPLLHAGQRVEARAT